MLHHKWIVLDHQREESDVVHQSMVHCTVETQNAVHHDTVHCTVKVPGDQNGEGQNLGWIEALPILNHGISRKSPDLGPRPEGATLSTSKVNPNGGENLGSLLSIAKTKTKLRKSRKHRVNPDRFTQLTLQVKTSESMKPPRADQQAHFLDQSKDQNYTSPEDKNWLYQAHFLKPVDIKLI